MRITVLSLGTLGDVKPYVALALGLEAAGHTVTVATGEDFEALVTEHGLRYAPLQADFRRLVASTEGRAALAGSYGAAMQSLKPMLQQVFADASTAVQEADALIYHPVLTFGCDLARRFRIPFICAVASSPVMPTPGLPAIYGYSRHVLLTTPTWPASATITGYWFMDDTHDRWRPPRNLEDFLSAGPPPVYVGFGSMTSADPNHLTDTVAAALHRTGRRGVLAIGWGGLRRGAPRQDVYMLDEAPHDWLFPRMAAVVHHGGAGTTAAGLRAGKPSVVCPFTGDQPLWGQVIHKLGAGPRQVPQRDLTVEALAEAMRVATTDETVRAKAKLLGTKIRAEDGVAKAVRAVAGFLAPTDRPGAHR